MITKFRNFLKRKKKDRRPRVPEGTRYYVIGDIHGRLDLFERLVEAIDKDDSKSEEAETTIILLGDLVDRGKDSAGVIKLARQLQKERSVRILAGNHEEMFVDSFEDPEVLRHFMKHGGRETILSYGIKPKELAKLDLKELFKALPKIVKRKDIEFIKTFEDMIVAGDYLFVHAGIDPKRPLDKQKRGDLLWIRDRFLRYEGPLEKVVVHGHTIFEDVVDCGNRIGIDTGAFRSGVLTALVLEGKQRRYIKAIEGDGKIKISKEEVKR